MTLLGLLGDLVLLGSVVVVLVLLVRLGVQAVRGRWDAVGRGARGLGLYLGCYAIVLVAVALTMPRESRAARERECFDDWCAAGVRVEPAASDAPCAVDPGTRLWIVTVEVSSDAKRVRQRAPDARALLEDRGGREYEACAGPLGAHALADELGPGDSFLVTEPFRLPAAAVPAGAVISHGGFPGILIIGDDQSLFHPRTLLGLDVRGG